MPKLDGVGLIEKVQEVYRPYILTVSAIPDSSTIYQIKEMQTCYRIFHKPGGKTYTQKRGAFGYMGHRQGDSGFNVALCL